MTTKDILIWICLIAGIYANLAFQDSLADSREADWQLDRLYNPSNALLAAECRGRVTIYDGLDVDDVEHAMDGQFERIDSMMFVRTRHPEPEGGHYTDNDCE